MTDEPRPKGQRKAETLAKLTAPNADVWVASASAAGPYLVPLSLAWVDGRIVLALSGSTRTARNIVAQGTARLGLGHTRDVVMIDATLERSHPVPTPATTNDGEDTRRAADADGEREQVAALAEAYAAQADWDPRAEGGDYVYLVLRPQRIQAWREADEIPDRLLMRNGTWLV